VAPSEPYAVRLLSEGDVDRLRELLAVFGRAFEGDATYTGAQPSDAYLSELLSGNQFIALAALEGDIVIGGLAAYVLAKFEQARSEIYLYDLAVAAEHRRKGVATALIEALKRLGAEGGISVIFVQADRADLPAIALYRKLGVGADVLHFDIAAA
jgi:aminoglycoside 3-N-acetyltransferase I